MRKIVLIISLLCSYSTIILSQNSICDSLMNYIILNRNINAQKLISNSNVNVNCQPEFGTGPLMLSAERGNYEMVKYLLEAGADPNLKRKNGETALFDAVYIYSQALEPNLSMEPSDKKYDYGIKDKIAKILVAYGADIHCVDSLQINLLMVACMNNRYEMVRFFVKNGIDVDAQNNYGFTALMYAVNENHDIRIIRFLLKSGANKRIQDNIGHTALDFAKKIEIKDENVLDLLE